MQLFPNTALNPGDGEAARREAMAKLASMTGGQAPVVSQPFAAAAPVSLASAGMTPATKPLPLMGDDEIAAAGGVPVDPLAGTAPKPAKAGLAAAESAGRLLSADEQAAVSELLAAAQQRAQQTTSPWVNLLAPVAAALISRNMSTRADDAANAQRSAAMQSLFGAAASDPRFQSLMAASEDESLPAFARERAQQQLEALFPGSGTSGGGSRSGGGGRRSYSGGGGGTSSRRSSSGTDAFDAPASAPSERRTVGDRLSGIGGWFSDRREAALERRNPNAEAEQQRRLNAIVNLIPGLNRPTTPAAAPVSPDQDLLSLR